MTRPNEFSSQTKEGAFNRQGGVCAYCGVQLDKPVFFDKAPTITRYMTAYAHHLRPISHGGLDKLSNCIYLCRWCHGMFGHGIVPKSLKGEAMDFGGSYSTRVYMTIKDFPYASGLKK